jgi:hypothetical protein
MLDSALNLFAKHATVAGKTGIEVPITVQLGGLFLGPVRIFEFHEINWGSFQPMFDTAPAGAPAQLESLPEEH